MREVATTAEPIDWKLPPSQAGRTSRSELPYPVEIDLQQVVEL
ncbi:hypothetical protein OG535_23265 [Kitasatospora sp. NBC_00085]